MRLSSYAGQKLEQICVREDQTVLDAITVMNKVGLRLIPVLSTIDGCFAGIAADGDLRRFIAAGGHLESKIGDAINRSPHIITQEQNISEIRSLMQRLGIESLPLVEDGKLTTLYVLWALSSPQQLTAVIMAGGLGTRLAPLTDNCPKPLLPIAGEPILTHIVKQLRSQGVNRFVFCVNYLAEMIINHFGDGSALGVSIEYVHETMRMGTGGALGLVEDASLSDPFICLNGDILNDIDISALMLRHEQSHADATMVIRDYSYTIPYGVVKTSEEGMFTGSEEKPSVHYKINTGCYLLSKSALSVVPRNTFYDLPTLFKDMNERNMKAAVYQHSGRWIDVGNIAELTRARNIFEGEAI